MSSPISRFVFWGQQRDYIGFPGHTQAPFIKEADNFFAGEPEDGKT